MQNILVGTDGPKVPTQLSHIPLDESKRFQLGFGGNSVNCNMASLVAWNGRVLDQTVSGMTGDLVIDLDEDIIAEVPCGQEATVHFHHALNAECGLFSEVTRSSFERTIPRHPGTRLAKQKYPCVSTQRLAR